MIAPSGPAPQLTPDAPGEWARARTVSSSGNTDKAARRGSCFHDGGNLPRLTMNVIVDLYEVASVRGLL